MANLMKWELNKITIAEWNVVQNYFDQSPNARQNLYFLFKRKFMIFLRYWRLLNVVMLFASILWPWGKTRSSIIVYFQNIDFEVKSQIFRWRANNILSWHFLLDKNWCVIECNPYFNPFRTKWLIYSRSNHK